MIENPSCCRSSTAGGPASRSSGARVHDLPDYAYFNHSAHVNRGVSCVSCHGRVDQMDVVAQAQPLSMGVVPRLPPQPGPAPAPARPDHQHGLEAADRRGGDEAATGVAEASSTSATGLTWKLLDVSQVTVQTGADVH